MSWRQPAPAKVITTINAETAETAEKRVSACSACSALYVVGLVRDSGHLPRLERFQEVARRVDVELRIRRFDAEKEPVAAGEREPRQVEDRVIRLRQTVEREHAEHARQ